MSEEKTTKQEPARNASPVSNASRSDAGWPNDAGGEVKVTESNTTEEKPKQGKKTKSVQSNLINPSDVKPGMIIKLWQKIKEKNPKGEIKERLQYFEGTVIARKKGQEAGATITVRKVSDGVGVEKIFPLSLPTIEKIELLQKIKTRRAKLYFLKKGYKKRLKKVNIA